MSSSQQQAILVASTHAGNRLMWVGAMCATLLALTPLFMVLYYLLVHGCRR